MADFTTRALLFGRIFRFLLGVFFLTEVVPVYLAVDTQGVLIRLGWAVMLLLIYLLIHYLISEYFMQLNPVIGAILAFGPLLAVFFIGYGGPAATGALTYLAVALIAAAIRADPGCEVMSIPGLITGKFTHLTCIFFSPIDWLERKSSKK